jgi:hypothetical protein
MILGRFIVLLFENCIFKIAKAFDKTCLKRFFFLIFFYQIFVMQNRNLVKFAHFQISTHNMLIKIAYFIIILYYG